MRIRDAAATDLEGVKALLAAASLPIEGVAEHFEHFVVAESDGQVIAVAGLESYGTEGALLRSVVVSPGLRSTGLGRALTEAILARARREGASDLYLLTTTAADYFGRTGFTRITRNELPAALHASAELRGACPSSAVVMRRSLA